MVCASHNFWRLCQLDKANTVVPKNRPYKVKVLGQVFFFSFPGVVILVSFFVCLSIVFGFGLFSWLFHPCPSIL